MALTQDDVDRLEKAVATGTLTVEYDGRKRTMRSIDELKAALEYVKGQVVQAAATKPATQSFAAYSRD